MAEQLRAQGEAIRALRWLAQHRFGNEALEAGQPEHAWALRHNALRSAHEPQWRAETHMVLARTAALLVETPRSDGDSA